MDVHNTLSMERHCSTLIKVCEADNRHGLTLRRGTVLFPGVSRYPSRSVNPERDPTLKKKKIVEKFPAVKNIFLCENSIFGPRLARVGGREGVKNGPFEGELRIHVFNFSFFSVFLFFFKYFA